MDVNAYLNFTASTAAVVQACWTDLVVKGAYFCIDKVTIITQEIKHDVRDKWALNTACCEL